MLGLIFLRDADTKFTKTEEELALFDRKLKAKFRIHLTYLFELSKTVAMVYI